MRDVSNTADVEHVERRVGGAFDEAAFGVRPHRLAPLIEIEAVDQRRLDAVARQQVLDHVAAGAEQGLGRDDVIAGLQRGEHRGRHRRHARRRGARSLRAFKLGHALLEHGDCRIGVARVDEAGVVALEPRLALLGGIVDIALRQKQRLGRLGKLRAQCSGMNQPGLRAISGGG